MSSSPARSLEHFPNLVTMFFTRGREKGDAPFLWTKTSGTWTATSWAEAARQVAALEERGRLASEMHDSVSQLLFAAELALQTGASARAEELLSSAQNELRALVEVLRPADLSGGLRPALERLAERTTGLLEVTLEANPPANLPPAHAETLYRAAQEGVHNALKHASATRLRLRCVSAEGAVVLTLEDDGVGLSKPLQEGFGLRSLRDRATRLGGTLRLEARRPKGTRLELTLPLSAHA